MSVKPLPVPMTSVYAAVEDAHCAWFVLIKVCLDLRLCHCLEPAACNGAT